MEQITHQETESLEQCEALIERGMKTFVQVGEALAAIRDSRLYRSTHPTFEAYCKERWGFSRIQAHRLIEASETVTALPMGNKITSERQARELAKVEPERRQQVVKQATESTGGKLTAKAITEAARPTVEYENPDIVDEPEPEESELEKYVPSDGQAFYLKAWVEMEKITKEDKQRVSALTKMIEYCEDRIRRKK